MKARVMAGATPVPVSGMRLAAEVRSGGSLTFAADADLAVSAATVWTVEVGDDTAGWTEWPTRFCPVSRTRSRMGRGLAEYTADPLLAHWARHTVFYPEYDGMVVSEQSGISRGLGWMSSAYDHLTDPAEPWDRAYDVTRAKPPGWPSGSAAVWVTASRDPGDPSPGFDVSERKLFRGEVTIGGTGQQLVTVYMSSDESATLWFAGEMVLQTNYAETGKENTEEATMLLMPGTYAVGVDTASSVSPGGDGVDPVMVAVWVGGSEVWSSSASVLRSCRRNDSGAGSLPPGPTPGQVLAALVGEAQARGVAGWSGVSMDFTGTLDSYGQAWGQVTERVVRVGLDDYWQFFEALAETDCDVWMEGLTLRAAPRQGIASGVTLGVADITTMSDRVDMTSPATVAVARSNSGWVQQTNAGWRAEVGLEVGTALSGHTAVAVAVAALAEAGRWDGTASVAASTGKVPVLDYAPGDSVTVDYPGLAAPASVQVLSISAETGEGGLLWQLEVTG